MQDKSLPDEERSASLLSDFFDNATVGLHWQGPDGVIRRVNRAELQLLGYDEHEYVGQPITRFHKDPAQAREIIERLARGDTLDSHEVCLKCKDGSLRHALISANVLWDNGTFVHARCFTRDISELKQAQKSLEEADRRKSAILNASLDAIITMAQDGSLVDFNLAAERIFGYSREQAIGQPLAELIIPPSLRQAHADGLKRYLATGQGPVLGRRVEVMALHADGHEFPVELSISVVDADPVLFTATLRDITARKQAEAALQQSEAQLRAMLDERHQLLESERAARADAERLSALKEQFLATLSHELRTPLSAILGWTMILRKRPPTAAELEKGLDVIERNARLQTRLIEELLDTSSIASGKVRLDLAPVDMMEVVDAAVASVRPSAAAKGVDLAVQRPAAGAVVQADAHRLQQVLWNLLSNALKFTPTGGKVLVAVTRVSGLLEIAIDDSGEGIDPEFLPHVFERFRQADGSTTRKHGGLGLGLAIVRSLVEMHGGSVKAESAGRGRGARFSFQLPLTQPSGTQRVVDENLSDDDEINLRGAQVLVVDDDADTRELLGRVLAECGASVRLAPGAAQALELIGTQPPHLLVSDIGMPDVDGYQLIRQVRALAPDKGGTVPALALTAFARTEDRDRALQAGFDAHQSKPLDPPRLIAALSALRQARGQPD